MKALLNSYTGLMDSIQESSDFATVVRDLGRYRKMLQLLAQYTEASQNAAEAECDLELKGRKLALYTELQKFALRPKWAAFLAGCYPLIAQRTGNGMQGSYTHVQNAFERMAKDAGDVILGVIDIYSDE